MANSADGNKNSSYDSDIINNSSLRDSQRDVWICIFMLVMEKTTHKAASYIRSKSKRWEFRYPHSPDQHPSD